MYLYCPSQITSTRWKGEVVPIFYNVACNDCETVLYFSLLLIKWHLWVKEDSFILVKIPVFLLQYPFSNDLICSGYLPSLTFLVYLFYDKLQIIARFSPLLLCGSEEELVNLLKDNNDMIKEGVLHILAKAGGTIREQLAVTSRC